MKNQLNRLRAIAIVIMSLTMLALVFSACGKPDVTTAATDMEASQADTDSQTAAPDAEKSEAASSSEEADEDSQADQSITIDLAGDWNSDAYETREAYRAALEEHLDGVTALTIVNAKSVDGDAFPRLSEIETLTCDHPKLLSRFPNVKNVTITNSSNYYQGVFPSMPKVESLTCDSHEALPYYQNITALTITDTELDGYVGALPALRNLSSVRVTATEVTEASDFTATLTAMKQVKFFNDKPIEETSWYEESKTHGVDITRQVGAEMLYRIITSDPAYTESFDAPVIGGKILVFGDRHYGNRVDHYVDQYNDENGMLPPGIFAQNSSECDTLILVELVNSRAFGSFTGDAKAMSDTYDITVFNVKEKLRYQPDNLTTVRPPRTISSGDKAHWRSKDEVHGVLSADVVYEYVAGLLEGES